MSKKLIIVLNEKSPEYSNCKDGVCPFSSSNSSNNSICHALWSTPPVGRDSLASLCNYYDTTNLYIIENTTNEELNNMLDEIINKYNHKKHSLLDYKIRIQYRDGGGKYSGYDKELWMEIDEKSKSILL